MIRTIKDIIKDGKKEELIALFTFGDSITPEKLSLKFNLWARYFFPQYFKAKDAPFHKEMDMRRACIYLGVEYNGIPGSDREFLNIAFRLSAKTTRAKLFRAFVIANDWDKRRRYMRILSKDIGNAKQSVTDIYNILIYPSVKSLYPSIFEKTDAKREETMASFTTSTGVKLIADTIGTDKRGALQDDARPDFDWYDDFETRISLSSAVTTFKIWENMEEAKNGLAKNGASEYTCNYVSERGNVHKLVEKVKNKIIVPIEDNGVPTWCYFTKEDIKRLRDNSDDYEGEYLCKPSAGKDVMFDRDRLDSMGKIEPIHEIGEFKIFKDYNASHRYAGGADTAGGVGLDSSTSVFIDFDTFPAQVVATFKSNAIKPDVFGHELAKQGCKFGECLLAPENNKFDMAIGELKHIYPLDKIFIQKKDDSRVDPTQTMKSADYGWNTNPATKPKMLFALAKAIEDGHLILNDKDLIAELRSYTRNDLMDREEDPRLTTRHFDLLIACAIAWQMKDYAQVKKEEEVSYQPRHQTISPFEGSSDYEGEGLLDDVDISKW